MKFPAKKLKHLLQQVLNSSQKEATWVVPRRRLTSLKNPESLLHLPPKVLSHSRRANSDDRQVFGTAPEKRRIAVASQSPAWRWRKTVNALHGLRKKSMRDSPRLWKVRSISASRMLLNTPKPPLERILLSWLDPILAVPSAL